MSMVRRIDQNQKNPVNYLQKEVKSIIMVIIRTSSLYQWSEEMGLATTLVLLLLDDIMKRLELYPGASGGIHTAGTTYMTALENKW